MATTTENALGNIEFRQLPSVGASLMEIDVPHGSSYTLQSYSRWTEIALWGLTVADYTALRDECQRAIDVLTSEGVTA